MSDGKSDAYREMEEGGWSIGGPRRPIAPASNSRRAILTSRMRDLQLAKIEELLNQAGVPEWVEIDKVPGNSLAARLEWFLLRRKDVSAKEREGACSLNAQVQEKTL